MPGIAFILILSFFMWPLCHAIQGNSRKTRMLRSIVLFQVAISSFLVLVTLYDQYVRHKETGEIWAGAISLLIIFWILCMAASLLVILFVPNRTK